MEIAITIVVTLIVVVAISAVFLIRPRKKLNYGKMIDNDYRPDDMEPVSRPVERTHTARFNGSSGDSGLTTLVIIILRGIIGLAAVGVLAYIYTSTQNALDSVTVDAQITRIYTAGIFKAVITIGITSALYIFTKISR